MSWYLMIPTLAVFALGNWLLAVRSAQAQSDPLVTPRVILAPSMQTQPRRVAPLGGALPANTVPAGAVRVTAVPEPQLSARVVQGYAVPPGSLSLDTPIIPEHIFLQRKETGTVTMPAGYRPVFEDGRLNPNRGVQTIAGQMQMGRVWTDTVPRRLVPVELEGRAPR